MLLRVRTLVGLVVAIPVLATAGISVTVVQDRWEDRRASVALTEAAESFDRAVTLRSAVSAEEIHSVVLTLAPFLGTDLSAVANLEVTRYELGKARRVVDDAIVGAPDILHDEDLRALRAVRRLVDQPSPTWDEIDPGFRQVDRRLGRAWAQRLAAIERQADARALSADLRARLRAVREVAAAFDSGARLLRLTAQVQFEQERTAEISLALLEADGQFRSATARLLPDLGVEAQRAWRRLEVDPAARRSEEAFRATRELAMGLGPSHLDADGDIIAEVSDSQRRSVLLIDVIAAASDDLKVMAEADSAQAADAALRWGLGALAVALASLLSVAVLGRVLAHPTAALERAARRVAEGEFDIPAVPVRGPREIAATVQAFNDMAATLAAVEDHAVALAEDPDSPVHGEQLPGRTGRAMQAALDALRASIDLAEEQRAKLAELAVRDDLTGLLNRKGTLDAVDRVMAGDERAGRRTIALFIDVDGLKQINDGLGHAAGDAAIRAVARALLASTRQADVVGRIGGDEFLVVGSEPAGGVAAVEAMAERVLEAVRAATVERPDGGRTALRCSIGVAASGPVTATSESLVHAADAGLYAAKRGGRDRIAWADA